ncbi:hypothetical protein JXR93_09250 [bacterium]|nr:hypothetical protein [bacterium]
MLKKRFYIIQLILLSFFIQSKTLKSDEYLFLEKGYTLEQSLGLGFNFETISPDISYFGSLHGNIDFYIVETIGIGLSDYIFYNTDNPFIIGNHIAIDFIIKPIFAIFFVKNRLTKNYKDDYFWSSFAIRIGTSLKSVYIEKNNESIKANSLGFRLGVSFNTLLWQQKKTDYFLKFSFIYNFMENQTLFGDEYHFDGFYFSVTFGFSFKFGDSIDWLVGENPNSPIDIKYSK